jgi:hypothetical protein
MGSPNLALQATLVSTIRALNTAAAQRVYSEIPQNAIYPYVQVWAGYETPIDEECFDRTESVMQIDVWADAVTYIKTKEVSAAIRNALHETSLAVTGHIVDRVRVEGITYTEEPPYYRARMSISIDTQPA